MACAVRKKEGQEWDLRIGVCWFGLRGSKSWRGYVSHAGQVISEIYAS